MKFGSKVNVPPREAPILQCAERYAAQSMDPMPPRERFAFPTWGLPPTRKSGMKPPRLRERVWSPREYWDVALVSPAAKTGESAQRTRAMDRQVMMKHLFTELSRVGRRVAREGVLFKFPARPGCRGRASGTGPSTVSSTLPWLSATDGVTREPSSLFSKSPCGYSTRQNGLSRCTHVKTPGQSIRERSPLAQ